MKKHKLSTNDMENWFDENGTFFSFLDKIQNRTKYIISKILEVDNYWEDFPKDDDEKFINIDSLNYRMFLDKQITEVNYKIFDKDHFPPMYKHKFMFDSFGNLFLNLENDIISGKMGSLISLPTSYAISFPTRWLNESFEKELAEAKNKQK